MLLADCNEAVRLGVKSTLSKGRVQVVIDEAKDGMQLMASLQSRDYELLMIDPVLDRSPTEGLIRRMRDIAPASNILVFTEMEESLFGMRTIRSGARGYLMKSCSTEELINAVTRVGEGRMHISSLLSEEITKQFCNIRPVKPHDQLTDRELQVFSMLVCGKSLTEAGQKLCLSVKTISTHKMRIMKKLGISNLSEMIQYAISQNLLEGCETTCKSF